MIPLIDYPRIRPTAEVKSQVIDFIAALPEDELCCIVIVPVGGRPSEQQYGYYFGVVCHEFAKYRATENGEGYSVELAHQILSAECLPSGVESTTELSPARFVHYVEDCRNWLADRLGIQTQDPDPRWREKGDAA